MTGHLLGYARVSTTDRDAALQVDAPQSAGCDRVVVETVSGALTDRPRLTEVLLALSPATPSSCGG